MGAVWDLLNVDSADFNEEDKKLIKKEILNQLQTDSSIRRVLMKDKELLCEIVKHPQIKKTMKRNLRPLKSRLERRDKAANVEPLFKKA